MSKPFYYISLRLPFESILFEGFLANEVIFFNIDLILIIYVRKQRKFRYVYQLVCIIIKLIHSTIKSRFVDIVVPVSTHNCII